MTESNSKKSYKIIGVAAPVVLLALLLGLWELLVRVNNIPPTLVPTPSSVFRCLFTNFGELAPHLAVTLETILLGFLIGAPFGILFAAIITNFKLVNDALSPFIIVLVVTPLMTLMPLLCVWMGFDQKVRVVGTIIQCFPIINMNSCTGLTNVPNIQLELMQSLKANRIQQFFRVSLPAALPDIFTGLKLGSIFATTGCIAVEYISSNEGLGNRIQFCTVYYKMDVAFSCIFLVAAIGVVLYVSITLLEKAVIRWKT